MSLLLILAGLAVYGHTASFPFVHDDIVLIQQNSSLREQTPLKNVFFNPVWENGRENVNTYYRPGLDIYNRLIYGMFGANTGMFHFANVLLHIINSIMVFYLCDVILKSRGAALTAAFLFLLHPIQTQAVGCVSGISNILYVLFLLSSLGLYIYIRRSKPAYINVLIYSGALVCYLFAILSKEQAIILPGLMILYELCFCCPHKEPRKRKYVQIFGFVAVAAGYLLFRQTVTASTLVEGVRIDGELWLRVATIPKQILIYLRLLIFPSGLHYYRSLDVLGPLVGSYLIFGIVLGGMGYLAFRISRKERGLALFGLGWFFIALLPTLNIAPVIIEFSHISTAEHFLYLPCVGFFIYASSVLSGILKKKHKKYLPVAISIVVILSSILAYRQLSYWKNEVVLFERALQYEKNLGRVYALAAKAYYQAGQPDQALRHFHKAEAIFTDYLKIVKTGPAMPFYLGFLKGIYFDTAYTYQTIGRDEKTVEYYLKSLQLDPNDIVVMNNLGLVYLKLEERERAWKYFNKALVRNPNDVRTLSNLGYYYIQSGRMNEAREIYNKVLMLDPGYPPAVQNLRKMDHDEGRIQK